MVICQICKGEFGNNGWLNKHIKEKYNLLPNQYYDKWIKKEEIKCKRQECNNKTKFISLDLGYSKGYCSKHCSNIDTSCFKIKYWITKGYSEEEAKKKIYEIASNRALSKYIQKYGEEEGKLKWDERTKKGKDTWNKRPLEVRLKINKSKKNTLSKYIQKYGDEEGKLKWDEYRKLIGCSLSKYIQKYGEEEGKLKWDEYRKKLSTNSSCRIEYYLKQGMSKEQAKEELRKRQANGSLSKYIQKYGEEEGKLKWDERQKKWQNTLNSKSKEEIERINKSKGISLENLIQKYGEEEGKLKWEKWYNSIIKRKDLRYSQVSQELFNSIKNELLNENFLFGENEYWLKINNNFYLYDFTDVKNKKIIEFNGDYWHANPEFYKAEDIVCLPGNKIQAKEIWEKDKEKINLAKVKGFDVLIVWGNEYKNNKEKVIQKCLNFLKGGK